MLTALAPEGQRALVAQQFDFAKVNVLEISSIYSPGLQSHLFELRAHVIGGKLKATRAGAAAFKKIIGEEFHVGPNRLRPNLPQKFLRRKIRRAGLSKGG